IVGSVPISLATAGATLCVSGLRWAKTSSATPAYRIWLRHRPKMRSTTWLMAAGAAGPPTSVDRNRAGRLTRPEEFVAMEPWNSSTSEIAKLVWSVRYQPDLALLVHGQQWLLGGNLSHCCLASRASHSRPDSGHPLDRGAGRV